MRSALTALATAVLSLALTARPVSSPDAGVRRALSLIRSAVIERSAGQLLQFVAPEGILCGDDMIGLDQVQRDLADSKGALHARVFGDLNVNGFRQWFLSHPEARVRIDFMKVHGKASKDWACGRYYFGKSAAPFEFCLFQKGGRWYLTNSLYDCE